MPFKQPLGASTQNQQPPHFIRPLQDKRVTVGQRVILECQVDGHPEPTIKWLKEGQNVTQCPDYVVEQDGARHRLVIARVDMSDSGRFSCQALNAAGSKNSSCTLIVAQPPSPAPGGLRMSDITSPAPPGTPVGPSSPMFVKELKHQPLKLGGNAFFECRVVASPAPAIIWLKNGQSIQSGQRYRIDNDPETGICTLQISMMFAEDVGEYACQAANTHGMATTVAQCMQKDKYEDWLSEEQTKITREKKRTMMQELDSTVQQPRKQKAQGQFYRPKSERWIEQRTKMMDNMSDYDSSFVGSNGAPSYTSESMQWISESETEPELYGSENQYATNSVIRTYVNQQQTQHPQQRNISQQWQQQIQQQQQFQQPQSPQPQWLQQHQQQHSQVQQNYQVQQRQQQPAQVQAAAQMQQMPQQMQQQAYQTQQVQHQRQQVALQQQQRQQRQVQQVQPVQTMQPQQQQPLRQVQLNVQQQQHQQQLLSQMQTQEQHSQQLQQPQQQQGFGPQIKQPLRDVVLNEGQDAVFQCHLTGQPKPMIQWFKNRHPLAASQRFLASFEHGFAMLRIKMAFPEDSGQYTMVAENQFGQVEASANLKVSPFNEPSQRGPRQVQLHTLPKQEQRIVQQTTSENVAYDGIQTTVRAPQFARVPGDVTVRERQSARFDIKAAGRPQPTIEWFKDDVPISEGNKFRLLVNQEGVNSLMVNTIEPQDAGVYSCVARNSGGEARCSFNLIVHASEQELIPQFVERFPSVALKEGESFSLRCRAVGKPVPNLVWSKDNVQLNPGQPYQIETRDGESTLHVQGVSTTDAGWYQCVAINDAGTSTLRGRISVQPKDSPTPVPLRQIQTIAQRQQITDSQQREVVTLRHIERSKARRREEEEQIETEPPVFHSQLKSLQLDEGKSAHFEVRLTPVTDPDLKIIWLFNGHPIPASSRISWLFDFGYATLDIHYVYPEDSGTYTCFAHNRLGQAEVSTTLMVQGDKALHLGTQHPDSLNQIEYLEFRQTGPVLHELEDSISREPPNFLSQLKPAEVGEGRPAHLEAKLAPASDANLKVEWFHNGRPLQMGSRFRVLHDFGYVALDILYTIPEDSGTYTCRATNPLGTVETSAILTCHASYFASTDTAWVEPEDMDTVIAASQPPQFLSKFQDTQVAEQHRCHFEAKLVPMGDPFLRIEWLKDGFPLTLASRIQTHFDFGYVALTMNYTNPEDSGVYTCIATNRVGQAQTSARLICQGKPGLLLQSQHEESLSQIDYLEGREMRLGPAQIDRPEESQSLEVPRFVRELSGQIEINQGQNVHFECRLTPVNDPRLIIEWLHNGQPLQTGHRFRPMFDFGFVALDILYAYPEDSGTYTVVAKNSLGQCQSQCTLAVKASEILYLDPLHPEGLERIQQLEEHKPAPRHDGPEPCCTGPPRLAQQFQQIIRLKQHQSLQLVARLEPQNDPTMKVDWFLNNKALITGSRIMLTKDFGYIFLDISSAIPEDSGVYVLRAVNAMGEATATCQVIVEADASILTDTEHMESLKQIEELESIDKMARPEVVELGPQGPPVFVKPLPTSLPTVAEAQLVHLECQVQPTNDNTLRLEWFRNGFPVPAGHRFKSFHDFGFVSFDILNMYPEDSGIYQCVATNSLGRAVTQVEMHCQGKHGIISQTQHPESVQRIMELEAPKPTPEEEEEMMAGPPQFIQHLKNATDVKEAEFVHLECQVVPVHDNTLTVEWYVNGQPLQTGHRFQRGFDFGFATLNILYLYPEDSGTYTCVARSASGEAQTQCTVSCRGKKSMYLESQHPESLQRILQLEAPKPTAPLAPDPTICAPHFTKNLQGLENLKEGQTAHLDCQVQPTNDHYLKIEWFHNGKPLAAGHRFRLVHEFGYVALDILWVYPEDSGTYVCRASNSLGVVETTCTISCSGKRQIYTDPNHPESWKKIKQMEEALPAAPTEIEVAKMAPVIVAQLNGPLEVKEGQSVHLEGQIQPTNDNKLRVEWYFNGIPLKQGHRFRTVHEFGYCALDILYAYPEDTGTYLLRAINELGEATTTTQIKCHALRSLFLDTQHADSLRKIEEMETAPAPRPPTPEKVFPKPNFTIALSNLENLVEGQHAHLECRVQPVGDPNLKVEWLKNGFPLGDGNRLKKTHDFDYVSLDIFTVYGEDSGVYSCRATNLYGEAVTSANVKCQSKASLFLESQHEESWRRIQELESRPPPEKIVEEAPVGPPKFTVPLPGLGPLQEGQPVHLETQVIPTNDNKLKIQWFHNGKPLIAGHRFKLTHDFGYVAMDILYAFPEDTGTWTCKAINEHGQDENTTQFEVQSRRSIITDVQHQESWARIQEIEAEKAQAPEAPELVHPAPIFVQQLQHVERLEGQPAHFECRLTPIADPTMVVEWFHEGRPLHYSNRFMQTIDFGFINLDILYSYPEDAGAYVCKARNSKGEATTTATLVVQAKGNLLLDTQHPSSLQRIRELETPAAPEPERPEIEHGPPVFNQQLNSCPQMIEGQPAHFECRVEPVRDPNLRIEWYRNGIPLIAGSRIQWIHDFGFVTMNILYCLPEDNGTYTCRAINKFGEATTAGELVCKARSSLYLETQHKESWERIKLIEAPKGPAPEAPAQIFQKPIFTQPLQNVAGLVEGSSALLDCRLIPVNDPNLRVEWYFNDHPLVMSNRCIMINDFGYVALNLSSVYDHDSGIYICRAVNELGEAVTTASLQVAGKGSLILDIQHPESYRRVQELEALDKFPKCEIPDLVFEKPVFVESLQNVDNVKEGHPVHLECRLTPVGDPMLRLQWSCNGIPLDYGSRFRTQNDFGFVTLDLLYAYPEDSGVYTCKAVNGHGEAMTTATIKVEGYESILRDTKHPVSWQKIQELERPVEQVVVEPEIQRIKPHFVTPLENLENIPEGQPVRLLANFEPKSDDTLKLEWTQNGKAIIPGQLVRTNHDFGTAILDIVNAYPEHSGLYTLKISNALGEAASSASLKVIGRGGVIDDVQHQNSWQIIQEIEQPKLPPEAPPEPVFGPPNFTAHLNNCEVNEGEHAHFECKVEPVRDPSLRIEFYLNGRPLDAGSKYRINVDFGYITLDIQYTYPEDSGILMCKAINSKGEAVTSGTLKCQAKDSIITAPQNERSAELVAQLEAGKAPPEEAPPKPQVAPVFTVQLEDLGELQEGQAAHFQASVEPIDVTVEWTHNGELVAASSRLKMVNDFGFVILDISGVEPRDTGDWVCRAYNSQGEATSTGRINCQPKASILLDTQHPQSYARIQEIERPKTPQETAPPRQFQPPKFIVPLAALPPLEEGDSVHLEAQVVPVDDPKMVITWYHNNHPLAFGHRYRPVNNFGFCVLDILYAMPLDNGEFLCRARNEAGEDVTCTTVVCTGKAGLILHPQVSDNKSKAIIDLEENLNRRIEELPMDKEKVTPVFIEPLQNPPPLREGENAHFSARLCPTDDPELKVNWFLNGHPLKKGSRVKTICDFGFVVLEITPVYPEDSGEYVCKASNSVGEAVTTAHLTCEGKKSIIRETQLPETMAGAGQKIRDLEAPKPIPEPTPDTVYGPPKFVTQIQDVSDLISGQLAHFECQLEPAKDSSMIVEWYHNSAPIFHSNRMKMIHDFGFVILELTPAEAHDTGLYVCRARNKWGEDSIQFNVVVQGGGGVVYDWQVPTTINKEKITELDDWLHRAPEIRPEVVPEFDPPKFVEPLQDLGELHEGEAAHFNCKLDLAGDPSLRLEWLHDGRPVPYSSRIKMQHDFGYVILDILGVIPEDSGEYVLRATTSKGQAETRGHLGCKAKAEVDAPVFVTPLVSEIAGVQEGDTVHLECRVTPITDPKLQIQWLFNGLPLLAGHRFKTTHDFGYISLDILYAYPEDAGRYTCRAVNAKGEAETSSQFTVQGRPGLIFQRQAPKQTKADLQRHVAQYTTAEVVLEEEDVYEDGQQQQPVFKMQLKDVVINEGDFARLECQLAPVNDPNMKIEWFLGKKPVMIGHRFRPIIDFGFVGLDLLFALPSDSGEYTARATNKFGKSETKCKLLCAPKRHVIAEPQIPQGLLVSSIKTDDQLYWSETNPELEGKPRVRCPPVFTIPIRPTQAAENEPARFEVAVQGFPRPRLQWFINGREVFTGSRYKLSFDGMYYLIIPQVRMEDAGEVVVVAKNPLGEAQGRATLDIFLLNDFRRHQLKSAPKVSDDEFLQRELQWKRETMGSLGEAFEQAPKADYVKLHKIETAKEPPPPLETEELLNKFNRQKDEEFYEKIVLVDHPKQQFPPTTLEPVQLKPATIQRRELESEEMEKVALRPTPRSTRTDIIPPDGPTLIHRDTLQKLPPDEEERKFKLKPAAPKEVEVAAKDQIQLKRAKPKSASAPEKSSFLELKKPGPKVVTPKQAPAPAKEEVKPAADQVSLKPAYQPKALGTQEQPQVQPVQLKSTPTSQQQPQQQQQYQRSAPPWARPKQAAVNGQAPAGTGQPMVQPQTVTQQPQAPAQQKPAPSAQQTQQQKTMQQSQLKQTQAAPGQQPPMEKKDEKVFVSTDQSSEIRDIGGKKVKVTMTQTTTEKLQTTDTDNGASAKLPPGAKTPPVFTQKVTPVKAEIGRNAHFACEFSGAQPVTVIWSKDGVPIQSSFDLQINSTTTKSTLTISKVKQTHAGEYTARVQNVAGTADSTANLLVIDRAEMGASPQFTQVMSNITAVQGRPARFDVKVNGQPQPQITWFKDGRQITPDIRFKLLMEAGMCTLLIIETLPQDAGTYECVAKNAKGETRCRATLSVTKPAQPQQPSPAGSQTSSVAAPEVIEPLRPVLFEEGKPARFVAKISGVPAPEVKWYRNGVQIKPSKFFVIKRDASEFSLEIKECYHEDEGEYKCEATNSGGKTSTAATLKLLPKGAQPIPAEGGAPRFTKLLQEVTVAVGQKAALEVEVSSTPGAQIQWFHDGKSVQSSADIRVLQVASKCSLQIAKVASNHAGKYSCRAVNKLGRAECSAQLKIAEST